MKGGKAIATGSDGCVFDGTFTPDGTFTKSTTVVTKVFPPQYASIATNEYERMQEVLKATDGIGVLVATTPPITIASIPDDAWENDEIKTVGACMKASTSQSGSFTGLTLPLIDGTLLDLLQTEQLPIPEESIEVVNTGLERFTAANLVHMDFAARNVFYKNVDGKMTAMLGDFGATINISADDFDSRIQAYLERYRLRGRFLASVKPDGLDPIALALMIIYDMVLQGKASYDVFLSNVEKDKYIEKTQFIAKNAWVSKYISKYSDGNSSSIEFVRKLANEYRDILTLYAGEGQTYEKVVALKDTIRDDLKTRLSMSDSKMFVILVGSYVLPVLDEDACAIINKVWFPTSGPDTVSKGGRKRGGNREVLEFKTTEDAFAGPDLDLNAVGGIRRTRRNRKHRQRVKMSRRR